MSIRRIGVRSTAVGLGVLASMALMAAPSWAAKGGNSANAALCEREAGVLVAQDASTFKNAGACTSYAAKGGVLAKLAVQKHLESNCFGDSSYGPCLRLEVSGFGLKPESAVLLTVAQLSVPYTTTALGTIGPFTPGFGIGCPTPFAVSGKAEGTLASGQPITAIGTGPSSC